jgi:two-component system chemotaxis response regulator CheB
MAKNKIIRPCKVLVIGGSAGSLEVLLKLIPEIKYPISFSIVIVLHRKSSVDSGLAELLAGRTKIPVTEIEDKEQILSNHIYLAPGDYHLLFEKKNMFSLDFSEKVNYSRPSIDVAFESAADAYKKDLTCLLLSGANADGSKGMKLAKEMGSQLAIQDPETAGSPQMPWAALLNTHMDHILNVEQMTVFVNSLGKL